MKLKDYKFGFDIWALGLFVLIMIPNIVWFCVPASDDVLRGESVNAALDTAATVFQVIAVAVFIFIINKNRKKLDPFSPFSFGAVLCLAVYIAAWICYFCGVANAFVIIFLAVLPCLSLGLFELERKCYPALLPTAVFAVLHIVSSCINFL